MSETKKVLGDYALYTVDANSAVSGNVDAWCDFFVVHGNLQVQGNTVSQSNLDVTDNIISVNVGETGNGVTLETAGLSVDRGGLPNTALLWNESVSSWTLTNDGSNYSVILADVVSDTSPQLGGDLDVNGFEIQSIGADDLILDATGSGNIVLMANTGYLVFDDFILLPKQVSDPNVVVDNNFVYHKTVASGGSGLFVHNNEMGDSPDELVSKRKAILYGLIL